MDIAALSIVKNQVQLKQEVGLSVMKKVMDTAEQNTDVIYEMLSEIAEGNTSDLGKKVDVYI